MNRVIKFRGKLLNGGGWSEGNLIVRKNNVCIISPDDTPIGTYGQGDPETVGQFTSLTDGDGVEIYEGDVIKDMDGSTYEVVFIEDYPCFYASGINCDSKALCSVLPKTIIGNIHDNPELMEV